CRSRSTICPVPESKGEFQPKLHNPSRRGSADLTGRRSANRRIRIIEVRPVQRVEHFPSKAQACVFSQPEVPVYTEIHVEIARPLQYIGPGIAECELARRSERAQIEPAVDGSLARRQITVGDAVWPLRTSARGV